LAEVWLDSYKKYYYQAVGNEKRDFGDISDQIALRKRLNCKPFDWLVKNIFPDIPVPSPVVNNEKSSENESKRDVN
jgi:polypeptide N-acetylgalactosaminyltransferase